MREEELYLAELEDSFYPPTTDLHGNLIWNRETHQKMHVLRQLIGKPIYHHSCKKCVFLGSSLHSQTITSCFTPYWDFYLCFLNKKRPSILARYSCDIREYISGPLCLIIKNLYILELPPKEKQNWMNAITMGITEKIITDKHIEECALAICQNCNLVKEIEELNEIKKYFERVEDDEPEPAGECPLCGALAYQITVSDLI